MASDSSCFNTVILNSPDHQAGRVLGAQGTIFHHLSFGQSGLTNPGTETGADWNLKIK